MTGPAVPAAAPMGVKTMDVSVSVQTFVVMDEPAVDPAFVKTSAVVQIAELVAFAKVAVLTSSSHSSFI